MSTHRYITEKKLENIFLMPVFVYVKKARSLLHLLV